jgi:hypothetical protein
MPNEINEKWLVAFNENGEIVFCGPANSEKVYEIRTKFVVVEWEKELAVGFNNKRISSFSNAGLPF